jgi:nucleoside-diphosphate-sugar epimerase
MKPNTFITGATGFIGGALTARLIKTDLWAQTSFLVRGEHPEGGLFRLAHNLRKHGVSEDLISTLKVEQIICGDLKNVSTWIDDPRLAHIENVVNSAAVASFGKHPSIFPTNVNGVLELAHGLNKRAKIKRFIQISTAMACGMDAQTPVEESYIPNDDVSHYLDYTQSKFDSEYRLRTELPLFPTIIVRPTIVVGHTKLGCSASGSIYWVFRLARALEAFPCRLDQKIDVIPVDYCAMAIHHLLFKPFLNFNTYQISAGVDKSCSFGQIDHAISISMNEKPMSNYRQKSFEDFLLMQDNFKNLIGPCNKKIVLKAIRSYGYFAAQEVLFSNANLLADGVDSPPLFTNYAGLCEITSQKTLISEQMKADYK